MGDAAMGAAARALLDGDERKYIVSPVRFCWLAVATGLAGFQGAWWNNFGPIAEAVEPFYGWSTDDISLLNNWGPICYILAVAPSAWLLDGPGLKQSAIVGSTLVLLGAVLRCLHVASDMPSAYLMHAGQISNAVAGPIAMSIGPVLSATWFAPHERTLATAVVSAVNYGFTAVTFVVGPALVPSSPTNSSGEPGAAYVDTQSGLREYMIVQAGLSALVLLGASVLPARPRHAPSLTATKARVAMLGGARQLIQMPPFWRLALCYGVLTGFFGAWGSMLGPNMQGVLPKAVAEAEAGSLGCWGAVAGMFGGVLLGLYADRIGGKKKRLLVACCAGGLVSFLLFACICTRLINVPYASGGLLIALYATSILGTLGVNATIPLFYEMTVEACYPLAEGLVTSALTLLNNFGCFAFLVAQNIPGIGTVWMNWAMVAAIAACLIVFVPHSEQQRRMMVDRPPAELMNPP